MPSVLAVLCLFSTAAHAVPGQFTHQGRLLDADGVPLEGEVDITFRLITEETGGVIVWEEPITLSLVNGFYSAILGGDEDDNPLDVEVLSEAPVWLEMQLDGEPAMFPRSPINAVPYATMATVAEEVAGGPVDASEIAVGGTPVVNESGEWVGPAPTISWDDIADMPEDFADGVDDDTDIDTDSFAELGMSCLDGDIPVWDAVAIEWTCDMDQDTLAAISCADGQLISWSEDSTGWVCVDDLDTLLTEEDVDVMVADNGYAMASEIFSGSFLDLVDLAPGLADGDDDTQLTPEEVDAIVADNGYAMASDVFSGSYSDLSDMPTLFSGSFDDLTEVPDGLADGDDNTQLSEGEVDAMVADNGYAMASDVFSGSFDDLSSVPSSLLDGDDDTLTSMSCGEGQTITYSSSTDAFECTTPSSPETISMGTIDAGSSSTVTLSRGTDEALITAMFRDDSQWIVAPIGLGTGSSAICRGCGDGSDGEFSPIGDLILPCGEYNFTELNIPSDTVIATSGGSPMRIRVQDEAIIDGSLQITPGTCGSTSTGSGSGYYVCGRAGCKNKVAAGGGSFATSGTAGDAGGTSSDRYSGDPGTTYWSVSDGEPVGGSSGGTGYHSVVGDHRSQGGSGGGAVILFASSIAVTGRVTADGADSDPCTDSPVVCGGGGSGGLIWLQSPDIDLSGTLSTIGGTGAESHTGVIGGDGGYGYVRVDTNDLTSTADITPDPTSSSFTDEYSTSSDAVVGLAISEDGVVTVSNLTSKSQNIRLIATYTD